MVEKISQERWESAQSGEIHYCEYNNEKNYKNSALIILKDHFKIDLENDFVGKKILESGGGCYPASYFCSGLKKAVNVEPLCNEFPDEIKLKLSAKNIECVSTPFEDYKTRIKFDEVWFFNVLQHVKDPIIQIENAKKIANAIRVFEPIDTTTNNEHPHSFNIEFFKEHFADTEVKMYKGGSVAKFHGANCAYLVWNKNIKK
jgi:hypothetical protein